jgi:hypothetical protein
MPKLQKKSKPAHTEAVLDEMLKETFPASDAPQLDGLPLAGAPASRELPRHPAGHARPPDVPEQGDSDAALEVRDGRCSLGAAGEASLHTDADGVELRLPENPVRMDAAALERLITALQRHRPPLHRGR